MSAPWIAAFVCLWVLVLGLVVVVAGVLRRVAAVLEASAAAGVPVERRQGPTVGEPLPAIEVEGRGGQGLSLSELEGPFVLGFLSSNCDPCLRIAEWLAANQAGLDGLDRLVVIGDAGPPERLALAEPVRLLVDEQRRAIRGLEVPGTPFAVQVGADGRVVSSSLLGGPADLLGLLEQSAPVRVSTSAGAEHLPVVQVGGPAQADPEDRRAAPAR